MDPCRFPERRQQMSAQSGNNLVRTSHTVSIGPPNPCLDRGISVHQSQYINWGSCQTKQWLSGNWTSLEIKIKSPTFRSPGVPHCPQHLLMASNAPPLQPLQPLPSAPQKSHKMPGAAQTHPCPPYQPNTALFSPPRFPVYPIFHGSQAALAEATELLFSSKHLF